MIVTLVCVFGCTFVGAMVGLIGAAIDKQIALFVACVVLGVVFGSASAAVLGPNGNTSGVEKDLRGQGYSVAYASAAGVLTDYNDVMTPYSQRGGLQGKDGFAVTNVTVRGKANTSHACRLRYGVWKYSGAKHYALVKDSGELVGSPASCLGLDPDLNRYIR